MELNGFEIEKFNVYGFDENHKTSTCPKCSEHRKKKKDKCLSLFWDTGLGKCNHCGELIQLHTYKSTIDEVVYEKPNFKYNKLDDKVKDWFKGRGISEQTLAHVKITQSKEWMPQTQKEESVINFNYFVNDELVNIKYRDGRKNFKLYKGAEKVFYNLDSIRTQRS
jgi:twinkle protein